MVSVIKTFTSLGKYSGKYALSELLICAECGSPYKRKTWTNGSEKRIYWRCLNRIEHGAKYCPHSKGFEEKRLHSAICRALKKAVNDNAESLLLIKANLAYHTLTKKHKEMLSIRLMKRPLFRLMLKQSVCARLLSRENSIMIWSKQL